MTTKTTADWAASRGNRFTLAVPVYAVAGAACPRSLHGPIDLGDLFDIRTTKTAPYDTRLDYLSSTDSRQRTQSGESAIITHELLPMCFSIGYDFLRMA